MTRVIGLISGTSADGIDVALVDITGSQADLKVELVAGATYPYAPEVRSQILALAGGAAISMPELATLDDAIAQAFATAALTIQQGYDKATLIGSHGQTVYHRPAVSGDRSSLGYSLQLGRGALIAHLTGLTTVTNFRAADIAVGGQGAPLVPLVDTWLLGAPNCDRCVQNLGGIGNVTYLPSQNPGKNPDLGERSPQDSGVTGVLGWDTGPGNSLIDLAVEHFSQGAKTYDRDGAWAASGTPCQALVERWLEQDYFQQPPPKSTGRELFGVDYLHQCLADAAPYNLSPADILATLTELTAASVVHNYRHFLPRMPDRVLLCGGGSHNRYLRHRLQTLLEPVEVMTTAEAGLNADFKEAIAFAVLAYWRIRGIVGGMPQVTGAKEAALLGEIHTPLTVRRDSIETQGQ